MEQPFQLGVNYWPRRKAMYWWSDWDAGEVRDEFALIRDLGLDLVRIFLLWDDWQPQPDQVSTQCLQHLVAVCDIAAEQGLQLDVTFFTGHMSGPNWVPRWLLDNTVAPPAARQLLSQNRVVHSGYRNPYIDGVALDAQRLLLRTVVDALRDHPAIGIWNLGNEPDLFAQPPKAAIGQHWAREMTAIIKELDDHHPITCGLHADSLLNNNGLRVDQVFAETDLAVMHAYPMYLSWARHPLDPDVVPFTCALTSALCGKPALMEEWGGCTVGPGEASTTWEWTMWGKPRQQFMASEDDLAAYVEAVLPRLVDVGATGALMWCFADYAPELWDRPPCDEVRHERHFGLVRPDGSLKPHADVLRRFAATKPLVNHEALRRVELPYDADTFYQSPGEHTQELFRAFVAENAP